MTMPTLWRSRHRLAMLLEGGLLLIVTAWVAAFAFGFIPARSSLPFLTPPAVLFPMFLWLAARMPPLFAATGAFNVALTIALGVAQGVGSLPRTVLPFADRVMTAQMSMLTASLCALVLAALFAQQRNTTAALASSEQRLRLAVMSAGIYAFEFDMATGTVHRIGNLIARLGLPARGTIAEYRALLHPDDIAQYDAMMQRQSSGDAFITQRLRLRATDGNYITIVHRAQAYFDAQGRLTHVLGTGTDITVNDQARVALMETERRLQEALSAGQVFAFDFDFATRMARRSANVEEMLGLTPGRAEMSRDEFLSYVHPEDETRVHAAVAALTPGAPVNSSEYRFVKPNGDIVWVEVTERGTFDGSGRLVRLSGLVHDITDRKLAEFGQQRLIDELNHRVKNTLARVRGAIDRSADGHTSIAEYKSALKGRIGALSRSHNRLADNQWAGVSLEMIARDELVAPYQASGTTVVKGPHLLLSPDAAQAVSLVLHELATNAAKYGALSTPTGKVEIDWTIEGAPAADAAVRLVWRETTGFAVVAPDRQGFGTETIYKLIRHELGGEVELSFTPQGLTCVFVLPLARITDATALAPSKPSRCSSRRRLRSAQGRDQCIEVHGLSERGGNLGAERRLDLVAGDQHDLAAIPGELGRDMVGHRALQLQIHDDDVPALAARQPLEVADRCRRADDGRTLAFERTLQLVGDKPGILRDQNAEPIQQGHCVLLPGGCGTYSAVRTVSLGPDNTRSLSTASSIHL